MTVTAICVSMTADSLKAQIYVARQIVQPEKIIPGQAINQDALNKLRAEAPYMVSDIGPREPGVNEGVADNLPEDSVVTVIPKNPEPGVDPNAIPITILSKPSKPEEPVTVTRAPVTVTRAPVSQAPVLTCAYQGGGQGKGLGPRFCVMVGPWSESANCTPTTVQTRTIKCLNNQNKQTSDQACQALGLTVPSRSKTGC